MKYYLYILKSKLKPRHYIGITENLNLRLEQHNRGKVRSTKAYMPWELVYTKEFESKKTARQKEIFLKKNYQARKDIFMKK